MSHPGTGAGAAPGQKSENFGASLRRLLRSMSVVRVRLVAVIVLAVVAVGLQVLGPALLGRATDIVFNGVVGRMLPPGTTQEQAVEALRAGGQEQVAEMVSGMDVVPGQGIDFGALAQMILLVLLVYVASAAFLWVQGRILAGIVQRTAFRLRREVQAKIDRLPLRELDSHARGDVLSRVTNDIDNVAQTLQQTLSQVITSVVTVLEIGRASCRG